jgi:outer membrane protein assembly factor BamB
VSSSPAVSPDGSTVYVGSDDNNVYALNASTGHVRWSYVTGGPVSSSPAVSSNGCTVCFGAYDFNIYQLSASAGKIVISFLHVQNVFRKAELADQSKYLQDLTMLKRWSFRTAYPVLSSPAVSPDGSTVYFTSRHRLSSVNTWTGSLKWSHSCGSECSPPAVSPDGSTVCITHSSSSWFDRVYFLSALDALTGSERWTIRSRELSTPAVSPDGSTVYVVSHENKFGSEENQLLALNTLTGTYRWRYWTKKEIVFLPPVVSPDGSTVYARTDDGMLHGVSSKNGGRRWSDMIQGLFAVSSDGSTLYVRSHHDVHAFDASGRWVRWSYKTGGNVISSPVVSPDGSTVYVGSHHDVYALKASTGRVRWSYVTGGPVSSSPAVSPDGSTVYVGSDDNKIYALNASTGYVRWSYKTGGPVSSSPAVSPDGSTVYVGSGDNNVYALNAWTGTSLTSLTGPVSSFNFSSLGGAFLALSLLCHDPSTCTTADIFKAPHSISFTNKELGLSFTCTAKPPLKSPAPTLSPTPSPTPLPTPSPTPSPERAFGYRTLAPYYMSLFLSVCVSATACW